MGKIVKYMKSYWVGVVIVFVLLIVQAYCDLALPNYTADVLDTGIMQKGIENIAPQVIGEESLENIMLFMTENEKTEVLKYYTLRDSIKDCDIDTVENPLDKKVYELNTNDEDTILKLDDDFGMAVMTYSAVSQMSQEDMEKMSAGDSQNQEMSPEVIEKLAQMQENGEEITIMSMISIGAMDGLAIRNQVEKQYESMTDMAISQSAKAYWQGEYELIGVDMKGFQTSYLLLQGAKMLGMAGLIMVCTIIICYLAGKIGAGIGKDLRVGVFKKVISFSSEEMDRFSTSSLITRSTNDIQQIQMVITIMLRMCLYAPILGVGGLIKVLHTNTSMVWIIALAVVLVLLIVGILMLTAMPKFKIMQKKVDKLNLVTREILTGLPVIRAFSREKHETQRFDETNKDLTKTMLFTNRVMTFMMPSMMLVMNGISVLIVWVASKQIDLGKLQVGSMTAFITYAMLIIMSFLMLAMISIMLPRAIVSAERVDEILTTEPVIKDKENCEDNRKIKGLIKFDNVSFRYNNAECNVLENINFTAENGKTTAIIGSTGSGKSTLINLIPRFYDVTEGKITIDGVDIRDFSQHYLREQIGFVPQKGVLFSGDIKSNLSFGCPNAPIEVLEKSAEIAQAKEFIDSKTEGYDSPIAQGGTNVSGGQKQRLSIARAIAKNPKIYIFDDSFSALDFKTDVALRKALGENVSDATVLIVAQRIVTIMNADKIIVLDEGKIAGQGTHHELLLNCDVYTQIVKSQLSESEYEKQLCDARESQAVGKEEL